jgi:hypothetical protein
MRFLRLAYTLQADDGREKKQQRASLGRRDVCVFQLLWLLCRIASDDEEFFERRLFDPGLGRDARKIQL